MLISLKTRPCLKLDHVGFILGHLVKCLKTLCTLFDPIFIKSRLGLKLGHFGSKIRSSHRNTSGRHGTLRNHNRSTALERSVIDNWGGGGGGA